jgi:hypothetical protein
MAQDLIDVVGEPDYAILPQQIRPIPGPREA